MNPGAKAISVELTDDELKVGLLDGRTIIVPLAWYPRCYMPPRNNVQTGSLPVPASAFIGLTLMKISAWKGSSTEHQHLGHSLKHERRSLQNILMIIWFIMN